MRIIKPPKLSRSLQRLYGAERRSARWASINAVGRELLCFLANALSKSGQIRRLPGVGLDAQSVFRTTPVPLMSPALVYAILEFLKRHSNGARILEVGCGYSTVFFASQPNVNSVIAIEHNPAWARRIEKALEATGTHGLKARIIFADLGNDDPELCGRDAWDESMQGYWEPYITAVAAVTGPFDLVIVDGVNRKVAASAAFRHVGPKGLLVVHDTTVEQLTGMHPNGPLDLPSQTFSITQPAYGDVWRGNAFSAFSRRQDVAQEFADAYGVGRELFSPLVRREVPMTAQLYRGTRL